MQNYYKFVNHVLGFYHCPLRSFSGKIFTCGNVSYDAQGGLRRIRRVGAFPECWGTTCDIVAVCRNVHAWICLFVQLKLAVAPILSGSPICQTIRSFYSGHELSLVCVGNNSFTLTAIGLFWWADWAFFFFLLPSVDAKDLWAFNFHGSGQGNFIFVMNCSFLALWKPLL